MEFKQGFYKNNKTGNIYYAEKTLINATNVNDGEKMVEYYSYGNQFVHFDEGYCRNYGEFLEKFTKANIE